MLKKKKGSYTGKGQTRREIIGGFSHQNATLRRTPVTEGFLVQGAFDSEALSSEKDGRSPRLDFGKKLGDKRRTSPGVGRLVKSKTYRRPRSCRRQERQKHE